MLSPATGLLLICATALLATLLPHAAIAQADITISHTTDLRFGQIVATPVAGAVTVTPAGGRSSLGGTALGSGFSVRAAAFTVTGELNYSFSITLPASAILTDGTNAMTVDTFTSNPSGSGNLGAGGTQEITVGATLHVGASQPQGGYAVTFPVTVAY